MVLGWRISLYCLSARLSVRSTHTRERYETIDINVRLTSHISLYNVWLSPASVCFHRLPHTCDRFTAVLSPVIVELLVSWSKRLWIPFIFVRLSATCSQEKNTSVVSRISVYGSRVFRETGLDNYAVIVDHIEP